MTKNQIDYMNAVEQKRSNRAQELENYRSHRAQEFENLRSHQASEQLQRESNVINNAHYARMDAEQVRHNYAVEGETNRSNIANESIKREQNYINAQLARSSQLQAKAAQINAASNAANAKTNALNAQTTLFDVKNKAVSYQAQYLNSLSNQRQVDIEERLEDSKAFSNYANPILNTVGKALGVLGR